MKIEVRCCCIPKKLMGWIDLNGGVYRGQIVKFDITELLSPVVPGRKPVFTQKTISLPVELINLPGQQPYLALKSEETPLSEIRKIRTFTENKEDK